MSFFTDNLTPAELQMLRLAAQGLTNAEAAVESHVSLETVKTHRKRILSKLGAHNMPHAVALSYSQGILP